MMKKSIFILLICALPFMGKAQITSVGLFTGLNKGANSDYAFQAGNYIVQLNDMNSIGRLGFGAFVEHNFLSKFSFSHSIILHKYSASYYIFGSTTGDQEMGIGIFAVKYNLMLRLFNKGGVRFLVGLGIDINAIETPPPPGFSDVDLNEIVNQLEETIKPVVYYAGAELGYRAGRIDIALRYNQSLNSFTQPLEYQGETYGIPTRSSFLFLNIGFLVFDKNLRSLKNK